jgi:hypothetical protein
MATSVAITAMTRDGYIADALGGYPYCIAAPDRCSVGRNHGVEEEKA